MYVYNDGSLQLFKQDGWTPQTKKWKNSKRGHETDIKYKFT
jgi:hypothetical protein